MLAPTVRGAVSVPAARYQPILVIRTMILLGALGFLSGLASAAALLDAIR